MKRFSIILCLALMAPSLFAQGYGYYARRIVPVAALPATCTAGNGEMVYLTTAPRGLYFCSAANTFWPVGINGTANSLTLGAGGAPGAVIKWTAGTRISSPGDGFLLFTNDATTSFTALQLGCGTVACPEINVSAAVGGQTQGIIILRGDGTPQVQANLGAATNGSIIYCSDCTIASPCAAAGAGALAKRLNGIWVCN